MEARGLNINVAKIMMELGEGALNSDSWMVLILNLDIVTY